jgi:hypothetical protein
MNSLTPVNMIIPHTSSQKSLDARIDESRQVVVSFQSYKKFNKIDQLHEFPHQMKI